MAFCENLSVFCQQISAREQQLLESADVGDEERVEDIRRRLDGLDRQFIYM